MTLLGAVWLSSRPVSWVNTAYPFAVAYFVVSQRVDWTLVVGTLFFLVPYNILMYGVNDVFDYESDLRNPRKGGVEGALLAPEFHRPMLVLSASLSFPFLAVLVYLGNPLSWWVLALTVFSVVAYSVPPIRTKEIAFVDSLTSAAHFVLPAVYGVVVAGGTIDSTGTLVLVSYFLWGMASHAFGAVQDVEYDREAGIASIATAIGARYAVWCAIALYLVAFALLLFTPWPLPLIALAIVFYLAAVVPFVSITDDIAENANRGWRWFLGANFATGALVTIVAINAGYLPG